MFAATQQQQARTIIEYAQYVMDDLRIKAFIQKFKTYQTVADRVLDAFEGMVDNGSLVFKSNEELEIARSFNRAQEKTKNNELRRMIQNDIYPPEWRQQFDPPLITNLASRGADKPHPNFTDIPLVIFYEFAQDQAFGRYLYNGTLQFLNGTYFARDMDLTRQRYLVFAVYLWTKTRPDTKSAVPYFELSQAADTRIRWLFLNEFKSFIHLDVWDSSEYLLKQKDGVIMRLRLAASVPGSVVVQQCGERSLTCNKVYTLDKQETLSLLRTTYIGNGHLKKLGLFFECRHCQKETASLFSPQSKELHFYCDEECFSTYNCK